ncbi:MAG: hypothetical protein JO273_20930 [Methylobacteriaceae bacterium]|nr:hypothetical protein [Methylobacteriaceae bacterium]
MKLALALVAGALYAITPSALALADEPQDIPNTDITGKGNLSRKLDESGGVIHPKTDVDPKIAKPAPVPDPGSTPVIPPPGTPGGPPGPESK